MKTILVPTDFSEEANQSSEYAFRLALKAKSKIVFLHITSIPVDWIRLEHDQETLYPDISRKVRMIQGRLNELTDKARSFGIDSESYLHYNAGYGYIVEYARRIEADMIIMGSRGIDSISDVFTGSNTQRVVRMSEIPILVISKPVDQLKKVALVSDFSPEVNAIINNLAEFIDVLKASFYMVFINTPNAFMDSKEIDERIHAFKQSWDRPGEIIVYNDHNFEKGIDNLCRRYEIDLIVMATHDRKGLDRFLLGSLTENVINHLDNPVLSLHLN